MNNKKYIHLYTITGNKDIYKIKKSDFKLQPNSNYNINIKSIYDFKDIKKNIKNKGLNIKYNTINSNIYNLIDVILNIGILNINN